MDLQATTNSVVLDPIIKRIEVDKKLIKVSIDAERLQQLLMGSETELAALVPVEPFLDINIAGQFLRSGKEVRLVIGDTEDASPNIDKRLVREIVQARHWFEDLKAGRAKGFADLARKSRCSAAHVSRRISPAFMAPDIVEKIMFGSQPLELTPERSRRLVRFPFRGMSSGPCFWAK